MMMMIILVFQLLRSLATLAMSNARYFCTGAILPDEFVHYGLALDRYTHFTSPIRRYADVIVSACVLSSLLFTGFPFPSHYVILSVRFCRLAFLTTLSHLKFKWKHWGERERERD